VLQLGTATDLAQAIALGRNPRPLSEYLLLWWLLSVTITHKVSYFTYIIIMFYVQRQLLHIKYNNILIHLMILILD